MLFCVASAPPVFSLAWLTALAPLLPCPPCSSHDRQAEFVLHCLRTIFCKELLAREEGKGPRPKRFPFLNLSLQ